MSEAALANRLRQIKIPIPAVPTGVEGAVGDYLRNLRRAVEANLNALFATDSIEGRRIVDGSVPNSGLAIPTDFNVPLVKDTIFSWNAGTGRIEWTAGTLIYGGVTYTINSGMSTTNRYAAYVDIGSLSDPVTIGVTASATIVDGRWYLAFYDPGAAVFTQALQSSIIHGGLIQATTITATQIAASAIEADKIKAGAVTTGKLNSTLTYTGTLTVGSAAASGVITLIAAPTYGDTKIQCVKTDFTTTGSGFILGIDDSDSDLAKFYLGNTTEYLTWDGSSLNAKVTTGSIIIGDGVGDTEIAGDSGIKVRSATRSYDFNLQCFSANAAHTVNLKFLKSRHDTLGTLATTVNGETLGNFSYFGVDSDNVARLSGRLICQQNGDAASGGVPADMILAAFDDAGNAAGFSVSETGFVFGAVPALAPVTIDCTNNFLDDFRVGPTATETEGTVYFNYTTHKLYYHNGTAFKEIAVV